MPRVVSDMPEWKALGFNDRYSFECQRCGDCCRDPGYLTPFSLDRISEDFGISREEFYQEYCEIREDATIIRLKLVDGYCVFFEEENGLSVCSIHEIKPLNCRYAPLVPREFNYEYKDGVLKIFLNKNSVFSLSDCKGSGKGKPRKVKDVVKRHHMLEDSRSYNQVLSDIGDPLGNQLFKERKRPLSFEESMQLKSALERAYNLEV